MAKNQMQETPAVHTEADSAATNRPAEPKALRVGQAAKYLNVSERTVRRLVKKGDLIAVRQVRHLLVPVTELDRRLTVRN